MDYITTCITVLAITAIFGHYTFQFAWHTSLSIWRIFSLSALVRCEKTHWSSLYNANMYFNIHTNIWAESETLVAYDFPKHDFFKSFKFWTIPPTQVFIFLPQNSSEISLSYRNQCSVFNIHLCSGGSQFVLCIYDHYSDEMEKSEMAKTNSMYGDEQKSIPISFLYYLMRTTNHKPPHHYFIHKCQQQR